MKPTPEQVARAVARRKTAPFRLEDYLFPEQLAFVQDPSPFKCAVTTRRAGKTTGCGADLIWSAMETVEADFAYITLTRANAKKLVWKEMKRINRVFKLALDFNESELTVTTASGSTIYCSGASDRSEIEKFRGMSLKKVYIDECQSFPAYIEELIDDVLGPALMDHDGSLCLIGTPGPIPTGYFYDCSRSSNWAQHFWTFWDNPHIPVKAKKTHQELFERELKRRGVGPENPSIQREWFGRWVLDSDALVYHYKAENNDYESLDKKDWTYILGVDLGFNDADALAVLAWHSSSASTYLVQEQITRKQTISELVGQIEHLRSTYDISKVVVDTGGLGKKIGEEISRRWHIPVQPAEKIRKNEYIELMNDALRSGRLKARKDTRFAQDCMKVEWDLDKSTPDKKVISKRFHSDICEAVLYAWRESYSYTHTPAKPKPKQGTPEWAQEERDRLEEEAEEYFKAQDEASKAFGFE